jgi:transcriptional regulator with XRE-family HTH domain
LRCLIQYQPNLSTNMTYPNIKAFREKMHYKQDYVAAFLGIEQPEYSRIENGRRELRSEDAQKLADLYQTNVDTILDSVISRDFEEQSSQNTFRNKDSVPRDILDRLMDQNQRLMMQLIKNQDQHSEIINRLLSGGSHT